MYLEEMEGMVESERMVVLEEEQAAVEFVVDKKVEMVVKVETQVVEEIVEMLL